MTLHFKFITVPAVVIPRVTMPPEVGHVFYFTVKPQTWHRVCPRIFSFHVVDVVYLTRRTLRSVFSCSHVGPPHTAGTETRNVEIIPSVPRLCSRMLSGLLTTLHLAGKREKTRRKKQTNKKNPPNSECLPCAALDEETATVCRDQLLMKKQPLFAVTSSSWRNKHCLPCRNSHCLLCAALHEALFAVCSSLWRNSQFAVCSSSWSSVCHVQLSMKKRPVSRVQLFMKS